jgi:hypothetical protein
VEHTQSLCLSSSFSSLWQSSCAQVRWEWFSLSFVKGEFHAIAPYL